MKKFKVRYVRTVYDTYEAEIEAEDEDDAIRIIEEAKYGEEIKEEILIYSESDYIEVTDIEEIDG